MHTAFIIIIAKHRDCIMNLTILCTKLTIKNKYQIEIQTITIFNYFDKVQSSVLCDLYDYDDSKVF